MLSLLELNRSEFNEFELDFFFSGFFSLVNNFLMPPNESRPFGDFGVLGVGKVPSVFWSIELFSFGRWGV